MFGFLNRNPRRRRGRGRRAAEQLEMAFAEGPARAPLLLPAPEAMTRKVFLRRHGPKIKAMVTEAWRAASPEQRGRLSYPACRTAAWVEYQDSDPGTEIETVIQEAILKCAYGRAEMGIRPEWYLTGEATREDLGLERGFTTKELRKQERASKLRLYQEFQSQFKSVIEDARAEAKISMKEAKAFAWRVANAGVTDPAQIGRMIVRLGKVEKMASSGKINTRGMSPAMKAALNKPAGASCTSMAGKRAALKIMTRNPKGAELKKLVDGGSKDTLLYMLQASVSAASSASPSRTKTILSALAKKGVSGADLRGNLKRDVTVSVGVKATSKKKTTAKKKTTPKYKTKAKKKTTAKKTTSKKRTTAGKPRKPSGYDAALKRRFAGKATAKDNTLINAYNAKARAHTAGVSKRATRSVRTTTAKPQKPSGYAAALKRRFAGKASAKDNTLINAYNKKARAAAAKKRKKPTTKKKTTAKRQSTSSRAAESRGTGSYNSFVSAFAKQVHAALKKAGRPRTDAMKILGYAWTNLGGKDLTRAGQKPLIAKAIKAKIRKKTTAKKTTAPKTRTSKKRTTAKKKTAKKADDGQEDRSEAAEAQRLRCGPQAAIRREGNGQGQHAHQRLQQEGAGCEEEEGHLEEEDERQTRNGSRHGEEEDGGPEAQDRDGQLQGVRLYHHQGVVHAPAPAVAPRSASSPGSRPGARPGERRPSSLRRQSSVPVPLPGPAARKPARSVRPRRLCARPG